MKDEDKTKGQLLKELVKLRQQNAELKKLETMRKNAEQSLQKEKEELEYVVKERTAKLETTNLLLKKELKEQKQSEKALQQLEDMYKTLVKTSQEAVALHDLDTKIIEVSHRWLKLWGYENATEVIGRNGFEFIEPKDHKKAMKDRQKAFKKGFLENLEYIFIRKDGSSFIGELNGSLIKDEFGNPKCFMATTRDITERKKMEQKLRQYSEKLEQMVEERTRKLIVAQQEVKSLRRQIQRSGRYPEIIGNSPKILQVIDLVYQLARTNSTVLIYGETGSGKDLIAKAIHFNSPRKVAPFVNVNCSALPEHLIESELFGYVKGAFTGAVENKKGLFEAANKGTIFLNEIADIPLRLQGKLLQVLENQQIRRLGESKIITVDVRIIAATNTDLKEAIRKQRFREDLFYRLNVLPIKIPSLRERRKDIPLLVRYFLDKYSAALNKEITEISQKAMEILCQYPYPGNVRELENIVQHSIVMTQASTLLPECLPEEVRGLSSVSGLKSIAEMEKQMIKSAIQQCGGNLTKAAKMLGIHRDTLWRKRKKLQI